MYSGREPHRNDPLTARSWRQLLNTLQHQAPEALRVGTSYGLYVSDRLGNRVYVECYIWDTDGGSIRRQVDAEGVAEGLEQIVCRLNGIDEVRGLGPIYGKPSTTLEGAMYVGVSVKVSELVGFRR